MKDLKLSFPYPSTSRHNLSQDVALSLSMGLVIPARTVEVLPGDSHRIATSFSLISNPLVKPLLQSVRMRYCRFWVPRRIYHLRMRANNMDYDPQTASVRTLDLLSFRFPITKTGDKISFHNGFQQSSLFDYLGYAGTLLNFSTAVYNSSNFPGLGPEIKPTSDDPFLTLNAEPYLGYLDICRNYFSDTATNSIGWYAYAYPQGTAQNQAAYVPRLCVSPLAGLDNYIDGVQNDTSLPVSFFNFAYGGHIVSRSEVGENLVPFSPSGYFNPLTVGRAHIGLCVPLNRPDRLSRLFDGRPLSSQNAFVGSSEITIANLSFLSKLQRYLTRKFFGGTRYTDVMYSIFGQKVPHVDAPVLLDVFDTEIGSELVQSTNASETQNPGVLGGYFSSSGVLTTSSGSTRRQYHFNEAGYIMDLVYIMPRLFRASFVSDFIPVELNATGLVRSMAQGNFVPDMNGIGWQSPSFTTFFRSLDPPSGGASVITPGSPIFFGSEPSWQQYRTLPDICRGALNPLMSVPSNNDYSEISATLSVNSPLFVFTDRPQGVPIYDPLGPVLAGRNILNRMLFSDPANLNRVFGTDELTFDNIFVVFRYSHQSKRQVTKRFTLTFA